MIRNALFVRTEREKRALFDVPHESFPRKLSSAENLREIVRSLQRKDNIYGFFCSVRSFRIYRVMRIRSRIDDRYRAATDGFLFTR